MTSVNQLIQNLKKVHGDRSIIPGNFLKPDFPRIPSLIFPVDYVIGGGIPVWCSSCLWGGESSGKTTLTANFIASAQQLCWRCFKHHTLCTCSSSPLRLKAGLINIENSYDPQWFAQAGVDINNLIIVEADSGEEYVDICNTLLTADDMGLIVVDSLAALSPDAELEQSANDDFYALQTRLIGRFMRTSKQRLIREKKRNHPITLLYTNQMRSKIGVMFGSNETMSGGWGMKHEFHLLLRMARKSLTETDKKKFKTSQHKRTVVHRTAFSVYKEKVFTLGNAGEFVRVRENFPDLGLKICDVDDIGQLLGYAESVGIIKKEKNKWKYFDKYSNTKTGIYKVLQASPKEKLRTAYETINLAKKLIIDGESNA